MGMADADPGPKTRPESAAPAAAPRGTPESRDAASPLPYALAFVGFVVPFCASWAMRVAAGRNAPVTFVGAAAEAGLAALVAAAIGALFRTSRSSTRFGATVFAAALLFVAILCTAHWEKTGAEIRLPDVVAASVVGALLSLMAAAAMSPLFVSHRRLLALRSPSWLMPIARTRLGMTALTTTALGAWVFAVGARSSAPTAPPVADAVCCVSALATFAVAVRNRRRIRRVRARVEAIGRPLSPETPSADVDDLGVGEGRYERTRDENEVVKSPYRRASIPVPSVRGAPAQAREWLATADLWETLQALLALLLFGIVVGGRCMTAYAPDEGGDPRRGRGEGTPDGPRKGESPAVAAVRSGAWYPQQDPILVDINGDGVDDVVGLRWDAGNEARALFVSAHDGATLRPIWATEPVPSQWMSGRTRLLRVGGTLFLADSERKLHRYDTATGAPLAPAVALTGDGARFCVAEELGAVWLRPDATSRSVAPGPNGAEGAREEGLLVDRAGEPRPSPRPACVEPAAPRNPRFGHFDGTCWPKLQKAMGTSRGPRFLDKTAAAGIVEWYAAGDAPLLSGYDPASCRARWEAPLALPGDVLHHDPRVVHRLDDEEHPGLFTLLQLASGEWSLSARDATTGEVRWHFKLPRAERGSNVEALHTGGGRVFVSRSWQLDVVDRATGRYRGAI
jgi:hypothetical protein